MIVWLELFGWYHTKSPRVHGITTPLSFSEGPEREDKAHQGGFAALKLTPYQALV